MLAAVWHSVLRGWWLILLSIVITAGSAAFVVSRMVPVFRATTTLLLEPDPKLDPNQYIEVMSALSQRETINSVVRVAEGSAMQERVAELLKAERQVVAHSNISARLVPDTNLVVVDADSTVPEFAAAVANTVAAELHTQFSNTTVELKIVDRAVPPTSPAIPQPLNTILLGVVSGLVLGILFAVLGGLIQTMIGGRDDDSYDANDSAYEVVDGEDTSSAKTQPLYTTRT